MEEMLDVRINIDGSQLSGMWGGGIEKAEDEKEGL